MKKNFIYIISGPSGTGKSSVINKILKSKLISNIKLSISYTTRLMRETEKNKINYFFISKKKFKKMISKNIFLEYEKIFGNYYGTSIYFVNKCLKEKNDVFLEIDWKGANQIRKKYPDITKSILILPPSIKELHSRLKKREKNKILEEKRINDYFKIIKYYKHYDYLIVNKVIEISINKIKEIVYSIRNKSNKLALKSDKNEHLIKKLINGY
ncbi:MAG: guanylate kinase [Enterobacteriaceae bacterium]